MTEHTFPHCNFYRRDCGKTDNYREENYIRKYVRKKINNIRYRAKHTNTKTRFCGSLFINEHVSCLLELINFILLFYFYARKVIKWNIR